MTEVGILWEKVQVIFVQQFQREKTKRERCEGGNQRLQLSGSPTAGWRRGWDGAS